ncbi:hypothetical protein BpHYR1_027111 [Brachionus plicatilis]|uniref:Uncharacterized protein n=1 Tax=Brachionus plicatilis TaxID=10195 RepID=A0A3M7QX65_BRAPC|nr:hypothetical protein BpHYR1_027111 [Brachionus plicatilis]
MAVKKAPPFGTALEIFWANRNIKNLIIKKSLIRVLKFLIILVVLSVEHQIKKETMIFKKKHHQHQQHGILEDRRVRSEIKSAWMSDGVNDE